MKVVPIMPACRLCNQEIIFDDWHVSSSGKKIPLDLSEQPHECSQWILKNRHYYPCRKCGGEIYFDKKAAKSPSGKWVPQDAKTAAPHQCGI